MCLGRAMQKLHHSQVSRRVAEWLTYRGRFGSRQEHGNQGDSSRAEQLPTGDLGRPGSMSVGRRQNMWARQPSDFDWVDKSDPANSVEVQQRPEHGWVNFALEVGSSIPS